jgi:hypothetical protein
MHNLNSHFNTSIVIPRTSSVLASLITNNFPSRDPEHGLSDAHGDRLLDLQKYCHFRRVKTPGSEPPCRTPCVPGARPWTPT